LTAYCKKNVDEKVRMAEKNSNAKLQKTIAETLELFNVPGIIGPNCQYINFKEFANE